MSQGLSSRGGVTAVATALVSLLAAAVWAAPASAAAAECPASFRVLHDDRIGKLSLPKGKYTITLLRGNKLSCERASSLFTRFLEDYDGNLPGNWKVRAKRAAFVRGSSGVGFSVERGKPSGGGGGGGGRHPAHGGTRCPSTFQVLHNDRIGRLRIPAGPYYLTRLTRTSPNCNRISKLFAKFLEDYNGNIPGWRLVVMRAEFIKRGSGGDGFRIKPA